MGIRVKKMLGYGLTNVKVKDKYTLDDPRINAQSPLLRHEDVPSVGSYLKWVRNQQDRDYGHDPWILHERDRRRFGELDDCVRWEPEYGLANVLCIRPLSCPDWYRSDDIMDYIEETALKAESAKMERVRRLQVGIYPWSGSYMDWRTGTRIGSEVMTWVRIRNSPGARTPEGRQALEICAQALGYKDHAQAVRYIVPVVPGEIRAIAEFGNLFTSPEVILQLRPMLYVYWS